MPTPFTLATPVLPLATAALIGAMLMADTAPAWAQGETIGAQHEPGRACSFRSHDGRCGLDQGNGEVARTSRGNRT